VNTKGGGIMKNLQQVLDNKKHQYIVSITSNRPVYDALVIMAEYKIGAVLVMDDNQLKGIFSERDYAREIILKGRSSKTTTINEVMTSNLIKASASDSVSTAMSVMNNKRIRHLPVVENDKVIGMLSIGDLVKETIDFQQRLIAQLESYIRS
jgi:CBS domain-containing protein